MKISIYASLFTVYIVLCFIFILIQLLFVSKTNAKFCHKKISITVYFPWLLDTELK